MAGEKMATKNKGADHVTWIETPSEREAGSKEVREAGAVMF